MAKRKRYYGFRLKDGRAPASFMADGRAQELTNDGDVYKTESLRTAELLRMLPFLEDLGTVDSNGKTLDGPVVEDDPADQEPETPEGVNPDANEVDA